MTEESTRLLVCGASGNLGTAVLAELLSRGVAADRIVATTRSPEKLDSFAAKGIEIRHADFDQPETLAAAFAGVDRMLLISTNEILPVGRRAAQHCSAIDAAVKAGVRHILYTSGCNPEGPSPMFWDWDHLATEKHLQASGVSSTILRNNEYMEVHVDVLWPPAIESGRAYCVAGDGACAYVARQDCARAAAAALASDSYESVIYKIAGPEALNIADSMALMSELTGKPIEVSQTTADEFARQLKAEGHPDWIISCFVCLDVGMALGFYDTVTDDVERLTGKPPISLREFVQAND